MASYYVYKHTVPNGKVYIGITKNSLKRRWGSNGTGYSGQVFYRAIKKYGWDNIKHEVLYDGLSKAEADAREIELIALYKSNDIKYGYNIDNGGNSIDSFSDEHKQKISESKKGKHRSAATKKKISDTLKSYKMSDEHMRKIKEANSNRIFSEDALKRISESSKNRVYTQEQLRYRKEMLRKSKCYSVYCPELNMTFDSVPEAVEYINDNGGHVINSGIKKVVNGIMHTSGTLNDGTRLHWKRMDGD